MRFTLMAVIWGGGKKRALAEKISHVAAVILGKMRVVKHPVKVSVLLHKQ